MRGEFYESRIGQPFGSYIHDVIGTRQRTAHHGTLLTRGERRVQIRATHTSVKQGTYLVAHKGNQGRHYQGQARQHHTWYLVANRLARARRHHAQAITPGKHGFHQCFLTRTKTVVTEMLLQRPAGNIHCALTRFSGHRTPSKNKNRNFFATFFRLRTAEQAQTSGKPRWKDKLSSILTKMGMRTISWTAH